ncbi:MAG TPA: low temperature requirement protein A [Vicinamibacterales bacterium]|nr:low temperature requirement protein A [Vicinamibacterales bacterium]
MKALVHAPRLRYVAGQGHDRRVTWLELFFDLVFAAAVAQVASPLREDYSAAGLVRFTILFVLIWWAWIGHAVFSTRFDTDDAVQRGLTLLQMFGVAVMAANAGDALDSRSSAGFAAAYAVLRLVLVFQYLRARQIPDARGLAGWYAGGHGVAAGLWLILALVPVPERYWIWALAFAIDLGTPWMATRHNIAVPPDAAHLPERFGLFTLILLGESVIAVMHGIEHQEYWSAPAAGTAFTGMAVAFGFWWWYFDVAGATSPQAVRSRRDAIRLHVWTYAHLPLYVGIVVGFVGIQLVVSVAPAPALDGTQALIVAGALAIAAASLRLVSAMSTDRRHGAGHSIPKTSVA